LCTIHCLLVCFLSVSLLINNLSNHEYTDINSSECMSRIIDGIDILDAAEKGEMESVQIWLDKGGEINDIKDKDGDSALFWACWRGHMDVAQLMELDLFLYVIFGADGVHIASN
jgi:ankyrin repeat protein